MLLGEAGLHMVCVHLNDAHGIYGGNIDSGFNPPLANYRYFRLHGTDDVRPYNGRYDDDILAQIARCQPDIVIFDNTDSHAAFTSEGEYAGSLVWLLILKQTRLVDYILPDAVSDALRMISRAT